MKKLFFIFTLLVSFSAFSTTTPRAKKSTATVAPPAYNLVFASLKDSPTWRNVVLESAIRVANEKYVQFYQSSDPTDRKRTAFAKKILSFKMGTTDVAFIDIVNQMTNSTTINDLNDSYSISDNIYNRLTNDYDLIGGIVP